MIDNLLVNDAILMLKELMREDKVIMAALEEISKPVDFKKPIEICNGCGYFSCECICIIDITKKLYLSN